MSSTRGLSKNQIKKAVFEKTGLTRRENHSEKGNIMISIYNHRGMFLFGSVSRRLTVPDAFLYVVSRRTISKKNLYPFHWSMPSVQLFQIPHGFNLNL